MTWKIFAAGKPALAYAKTGIEEYLKRLKRGAKVELIYLKAGDSEIPAVVPGDLEAPHMLPASCQNSSDSETPCIGKVSSLAIGNQFHPA